MYDPELFHGMPVALQLVGRNLAEEELLDVANRIDRGSTERPLRFKS